jgi:hypothetical protein
VVNVPRGRGVTHPERRRGSALEAAMTRGKIDGRDEGCRHLLRNCSVKRVRSTHAVEWRMFHFELLCEQRQLSVAWLPA